MFSGIGGSGSYFLFFFLLWKKDIYIDGSKFYFDVDVILEGYSVFFWGMELVLIKVVKVKFV